MLAFIQIQQLIRKMRKFVASLINSSLKVKMEYDIFISAITSKNMYQDENNLHLGGLCIIISLLQLFARWGLLSRSNSQQS